jgi:hypothetical protein
MRLFGWEIKRDEDEKKLVSFAPEVNDDGALVVAAGGSYGTVVDLDGTAKSEAELVTRYRDMSMQPEVENALDEIVNESIVYDEEFITRVVTDKLPFSDSLKKKIEEEFINIQNLLNYNRAAYEIFKRWYVDGRLYYHVIIDENDPKAGIKELRYIDPRKIRKIREVKKIKKDGFDTNEVINEYYFYVEKGFDPKLTSSFANDYSGVQGVRIAADAILHCTSGLTDTNNQMVLSYLHKAIRPLNQLRVLEDATVIYRISRAPERRIFYIDVGNLPKAKAEQYVRDMMVRHKNRIVYDQTTGEVRDDRKFTTMLEDYWFPRRDGDRGTKIETLPAGQNLGELEDVKYFQKKLYKSLFVPTSRLEQDVQFSLATELSRDEVKFSKFVDRIRMRFSQLFLFALEKQLILKNIITPEDWEVIHQNLNFEYAKDNYFAESKEADILSKRLTLLQLAQPYVGTYMSHRFVRKRILKQDDDDIRELDAEMHDEMDDERFQNPVTVPEEPAIPQPKIYDSSKK